MPKKKPREPGTKHVSKKWLKYECGETLTRKTKFCPKCGPGVFLGQHANRLSCGKCKYTEFTNKKE